MGMCICLLVYLECNINQLVELKETLNYITERNDPPGIFYV